MYFFRRLWTLSRFWRRILSERKSWKEKSPASHTKWMGCAFSAARKRNDGCCCCSPAQCGRCANSSITLTDTHMQHSWDLPLVLCHLENGSPRLRQAVACAADDTYRLVIENSPRHSQRYLLPPRSYLYQRVLPESPPRPPQRLSRRAAAATETEVASKCRTKWIWINSWSPKLKSSLHKDSNLFSSCSRCSVSSARP